MRAWMSLPSFYCKSWNSMWVLMTVTNIKRVVEWRVLGPCLLLVFVSRVWNFLVVAKDFHLNVVSALSLFTVLHFNLCANKRTRFGFPWLPGFSTPQGKNAIVFPYSLLAQFQLLFCEIKVTNITRFSSPSVGSPGPSLKLQSSTHRL